MDSLEALRRCVKRAAPARFAWWPASRRAVADFYEDMVRYYRYRHETAERSLRLFERLVVLHGKEAKNKSQLCLDAAVAFAIASKLEETVWVLLSELASVASVTEEALRAAEKLALTELEWAVYSPTSSQFLDVFVAPGPERDRAAKLVEKFALRPELEALSPEEIARAALEVARGEDGKHTDLFLDAPATVLGKRTRGPVV